MQLLLLSLFIVTPFVGVWIETDKYLEQIYKSFVTPFVGVWIETVALIVVGLLVMTSHPSWVCGLKPPVTIFLNSVNKVTPFVGVWIETYLCSMKKEIIKVTPFVGVWIETEANILNSPNLSVTPFVGVWIETLTNKRVDSYDTSHPSWVCGLKPILWYDDIRKYMSHPSWVCGLKQLR